jgi:hypothetical protein
MFIFMLHLQKVLENSVNTVQKMCVVLHGTHAFFQVYRGYITKRFKILRVWLDLACLLTIVVIESYRENLYKTCVSTSLTGRHPSLQHKATEDLFLMQKGSMSRLLNKRPGARIAVLLMIFACQLVQSKGMS